MVRPRLTETLSWEEITEKIMREVRCNKPDFRKWLLTKESLGFLFDSKMYYKLYNIQRVVNKDDRDYFICIVGKEGVGKSTLGMQILSVLDPTFNLSRVCFKMQDYVVGIRPATKGNGFLLDEGNMFLFSRESMSTDNRFMLKLFALMRQRNLCNVIAVPNFFTLDSYVRDHRVDLLVYIHKKAKYIAFAGKAIKIISKEGKASKQIGGHKVPSGTYWPGYFNEFLPCLNDIDNDSYRQHKGQHFNEFLDDLEGVLAQKAQKEPDLLSIKETQQVMKINRDTLMKFIKQGKLKYKRMGKKYYVYKQSLLENNDNKPG